MLKINRERSERRKKWEKSAFLGIKNHMSAAVRGGRAPGAPPGSASVIWHHILMLSLWSGSRHPWWANCSGNAGQGQGVNGKHIHHRCQRDNAALWQKCLTHTLMEPKWKRDCPFIINDICGSVKTTVDQKKMH